MNARDYETAIRAEVEEWPGAAVTFETGGKHPRAVLAFGGATKFITYPGTPSSDRGLANSIADVRRTLRDMGAARNERPKSDRQKSERNPGADQCDTIPAEPAPVRPDPFDELRERFAGQPLIAAPGAYRDIAAEDYHGNPMLLPCPSLSSSGAKLILGKSPRHFWWQSPMNPDRPTEQDKPHFAVGRAAHDLILLSDRWPEFYHVTPEGFSLAKSKAMAAEIAEYHAAVESGLTVLRHEDAETVKAVARSIERNPLAMMALSNGEAETTLAWQDEETGVWLRARPDFMPASVRVGGEVIVVTDLKFVAGTHATPEGFKRAIANFGYHQSAAFYADGMKAVFGHAPTNWLHVVVEKEEPHCVALYELPAEDIERGRWLNREAIRKFARCLDVDRWPGYADEPMQVGLPIWARKKIDDVEGHEVAWATADAA